MYEIGEEEIEALARVIRSKKLFRYGKEQTEAGRFEQEWAAKIGVPHALAVTNGTAALACALIAAGVQPGDEVIVPGFTFMASAMAPLSIGAVPVLAEIDAGLMLDPADVARKVTPRTKAILPVHMLGHVVNLDPILKLAQAKNIRVVEDCCQCDGGSYRGKRVGAWGDTGGYSFNFYKIMSAGEGGAMVSKDKTGFQRARIYHDTGAAFRDDAAELTVPVFCGLNYRLDELRAAVLRVQLGRLDGILERLRARRTQLRQALAGAPGIEFAPVHDEAGDCGTCLFLRVESRAHAQAFARAAEERKLPVSLPYDSGRHVYSNWDPILERRAAYHPAVDPLHSTEAGRAQRYTPDMLPRTLEHLARTVSIGTGIGWSEKEVREVAKGVLQCLAQPVGTA